MATITPSGLSFAKRSASDANAARRPAERAVSAARGETSTIDASTAERLLLYLLDVAQADQAGAGDRDADPLMAVVRGRFAVALQPV